MPSSLTITAFYEFSPGTTIKSSEVNNNFGLFRGHIVPIDPTTGAFGAAGAWDLGSETNYWGELHSEGISFALQATSTSIAAPGAGFLTLFGKTNGSLYVMNASGTVSEVGSGSGGGGSSVKWIEGPNSPVFDFEDEVGKYLYGAALGQTLYGVYKIPNSYTPGTQLSLRLPIESEDTTGSILMFAEATLITSSDTVGSSANVHTSTASAINMSAGSSGLLQVVTLDLLDSSGLAGSGTATANSLIKIKLKRGTDTSTADIKVHVDASEVT